MDKRAWRVLKKLYPESVSLVVDNVEGRNGCMMCAAEREAEKKVEADKKERDKMERKKPLSCPLIRGFYGRGNKGYPVGSLEPIEIDIGASSSSTTIATTTTSCPLKPGVYWTLPRSWCKNWRKYLKTGEGGMPPPVPDGSEMLCEAHNLPLIPPHLEAFLNGESLALFESSMSCGGGSGNDVGESVARMPEAAAGGSGASMSLSSSSSYNASFLSDADTLQALRAAGLSELEVHTQRVAMMELEEERQRRTASYHCQSTSSSAAEATAADRITTNEQLDRENRVVVEILTDEEVSALEKWYPHVYGIRFAVVETTEGDCPPRREVLWHTVPCRECDPSSRADTKFVVRSRLAQRGFH